MQLSTKTITSVWMFTREYGELAGAGGVKDVASQLSRVLARWNGRKVHVVLPLYGFMNPQDLGFERLADPLFQNRHVEFDVAMNYTALERNERVRVWHASIDKVNVYLLEAERFQEKNGVYTYTREEYQRESWKIQGSGHFDFFAMNILLQKAGLDLIMTLGERPQIIHCHDGHTAVIPAMMRECPGYRNYFRSTAAVVTIHNGGVGYHQEVSDLVFVQAVTGLPAHVVTASCIDHSFDPFIAAGRYATVSTVSENYAKELQETDDDYLTGWLGHRLLESGVTIKGITNGIDPDDFNPQDTKQTGIAAGFDVAAKTDKLAGKVRCKKELIAMLLHAPDEEDESRVGFLVNKPKWPLYTFIGRLSDQKGIDILTESIALFLSESTEALIVCLGSGGEREEDALARVAGDEDLAGRICFLKGFDSGLANKVYAAGDFFVIPSRYEPCGLTDYIAQLFGNLPIVHHVGGLVKVVDGKTGFAYQGNSPENLIQTMNRAFDTYKDIKKMRIMQRQAVVQIKKMHTWKQVMKDYVSLYKQSVAELVG